MIKLKLKLKNVRLLIWMYQMIKLKLKLKNVRLLI